jgi:DNA-binding beta-propeller fold protein YncE
MKKTVFFFIAAATAAITASAQQDVHIVNTFHIASTGGWDYLTVSPVNNWLYVSHGTQVNVLNKTTGDSVGIIENTTGVHGIAFDAANKKGFTSNGRLNSVTVFDINTNKLLAQIATGINPDAIMYEPFSKKIITCNGRSKNLSIIDPVENKLLDSIDVGGKPETAVSDGEGKLFVNIEDKNEIVVVDIKTFKVMHHWPVAPGEGPTGLAIDKKTKRLFAGCEKLLVVLDAVSGNTVDKIIIGDGCDGVAFDEATNNIYTANGADGTVSVIHEDAPSKFSLVQTVTTKKSARTITLDQQSHLIYLPAADLEMPEPGQKGRPKMKPGTFQILVVGK